VDTSDAGLGCVKTPRISRLWAHRVAEVPVPIVVVVGVVRHFQSSEHLHFSHQSMPWSQVLRQFTLVPPNPAEKEFHGPYNKLLNILFPADTDFTVCPRYQETDSSRTTDILVTYEVLFRNRPVFILELKAPAELVYISTRQKADDQMRKRVADLRGKAILFDDLKSSLTNDSIGNCPIPILHGVSAMGTRLCFYHVPSGNVDHEIQPPVIERHPRIVNDTAPDDRWDCDVLDEGGERRLRAVVNEIHQACTMLHLNSDSTCCR